MSLGWQDLPIPIAERRPQVPCLAGFLGDDQASHGRQRSPRVSVRERKWNMAAPQPPGQVVTCKGVRSANLLPWPTRGGILEARWGRKGEGESARRCEVERNPIYPAGY